MPLVEYKLELTRQGMQPPVWVNGPGYWHNPEDNTYVGHVDPEPRQWYLPDTVIVFNANTFADRMVALNNVQEVVNTEDMQTVLDPATNTHIEIPQSFATEEDLRAFAKEWYWTKLAYLNEDPADTDSEFAGE